MVLGKYYGVQRCLNRVYSRVVGLALVLVTHQILPLNYLLDSADDSVLCLPPSVALESCLPHTRNQSCRKSENEIRLAVFKKQNARIIKNLTYILSLVASLLDLLLDL